ncbi:hypothetical protein V8C44DRAFT_324442 [Trichoderma aethiopicum]
MPLLASHHPSPPWVLFFSCFYSLVCAFSTLVKFSIEFILDFTTTLLKKMDLSLLHLATGGRQRPNFVVRMMMATNKLQKQLRKRSRIEVMKNQIRQGKRRKTHTHKSWAAQLDPCTCNASCLILWSVSLSGHASASRAP